MKILSIGTDIFDNRFDIVNISLDTLSELDTLQGYDYLLLSGGDGLIRRTVKILFHHHVDIPPLIVNPCGSFNVIAKLHRVPSLQTLFNTLEDSKEVTLKAQDVYALNEEVFLFSAGNMGDLQHIFLAEMLRFGILKKGLSKYILAVLFLLPLHLIMTPFMLLSSQRFFIFTPASFITKYGSFYGKVKKDIAIDLDNHYNHIELDGDIVTMREAILKIHPKGIVNIVVG